MLSVWVQERQPRRCSRCVGSYSCAFGFPHLWECFLPFCFLQRIEREATFSYQTLTVPEDIAANVLYVNGTLIHRSLDEIPESCKVRVLLLCVFLKINVNMLKHATKSMSVV
jgi:hypothetical protein